MTHEEVEAKNFRKYMYYFWAKKNLIHVYVAIVVS